jgi:hypothetical protein
VEKGSRNFLLLAGLDGIIDAKDIPTGAKAIEWNVKDRKTYAYLFFLIELNYCAPIIDIKSSCKAWKKLIAKYEKDSATMHMALHQQFYSVMHDPVVGITVFINAIFSIVQQLAAIGHKPENLEISDKLLIGLHQSWTLREKIEKPEIELITSALKQFEVNESLVAVPGLLVKVKNLSQALLNRLYT